MACFRKQPSKSETVAPPTLRFCQRAACTPAPDSPRPNGWQSLKQATGQAVLPVGNLPQAGGRGLFVVPVRAVQPLRLRRQCHALGCRLFAVAGRQSHWHPRGTATATATAPVHQKSELPALAAQAAQPFFAISVAQPSRLHCTRFRRAGKPSLAAASAPAPARRPRAAPAGGRLRCGRTWRGCWGTAR